MRSWGRLYATRIETPSGCTAQKAIIFLTILQRRVFSQLHEREFTTCDDHAALTDMPLVNATQSKAHGSKRPVYYNFKTLDQFDVSSRRQRRLTSSSRLHEDRLPLENISAVDESDPYKHIRIFRRDMVDISGSKTVPLSIDVPAKKFLDMFCDFDGKRCKLCNESFLQWHTHRNSIPHAGREGLLLEMVRAYCGTPEEVVKMWWHRLNTDSAFERIPKLSHSDSYLRKRRLQYVLRFLKDRCIIRDAFNVVSASSGAGRSWAFERLEWLGDNVVKYIFNNRLNCLFPAKEGGIRTKLGYVQFIMDGNDGLARAYDYLELQQLTESDRVVSKFKSDVVETLFGELEVYLWSTEIDAGTEYYAMPFGKDMYALCALVRHAMEELAHVVFMYHAEYVLAALQRIIRENQLQLVRADPSLRGQNDVIQERAGSLYNAKKARAMPRAHFTPHRVGHSQEHAAFFFWESSNYDSFKRVAPLGGLLPRPFPAATLTATPTFMPHLQVAMDLTKRLDPFWFQRLESGLQVKNEGQRNAVAMYVKKSLGGQAEAIGNDTDDSFYRLHQSPVLSCGRRFSLSFPDLLDERLITELI